MSVDENPTEPLAPGARSRPDAGADPHVLPLVVQHFSTGVALLDQEDVHTFVNPAYCVLLGLPAEALIGKTIEQAWPSAVAARVSGDVALARAGNGVRQSYAVSGGPEGRWLGVELHPLTDVSETGVAVLVEVTDTTDLVLAQQNADLATQIYEAAHVGIVRCDQAGIILAANQAYASIAGIRVEECIGKHVTEAVPVHEDYLEAYDGVWKVLREGGFWQGELWRRRNTGESFRQRLTLRSVHVGGEIQFIGISTDISELFESRQQAQYLSTHDVLTGLPNRSLFLDRLERALKSPDRMRRTLGLLLFDIEHLKLVNDTLGLDVGDRLLIEVAGRLSEVAQQSDTVARISGDGFALIMERTSIDAIKTDGAEILSKLGRQFVCENHVVDTRIRVGAAFAPGDGESAKELIMAADTALLRAREQGVDRIEFFRPEIQEAYRSRVEMEGRLRAALENGELTLALQAQVSAIDPTRVVGYEGLVRWPSADGFEAPDSFIPVAELSDLIVEVDHYVLGLLLSIVRDIPPSLTISVNISARTLKDPGFSAHLESWLADSGIAFEQLVIELTERSMVSDDQSAIDAMHHIRGLGVQFSIDDFGTGFSSMAYLGTLPVNEVKVDRSFVMDLAVGNERAELITEGLLKVIRGLGFRVVAEGVETKAQADWLMAKGCDVMQGFRFGCPEPAEHVLAACAKSGLSPEASPTSCS